jgi:WD40 repeat protein
MTRTDELTAKLLDGILTEAEWADLEALLGADPLAADDHLALLELEAVLRGELADFDLTAPTLAKVKEARAEKTTRAVMAGIATQPAPRWAGRARPESAPRSRRWLFAAAGLVAVAAGIAVGLWLGTGNPGAPQDGGGGSPDGQEFAKLTRASGSVEWLTPQGEVLPAGEGNVVPPGHTLRTIGEDSHARVELPDRTTVDIEPDSVVRFVATPDARTGKPRVFLAAGQLTAAVPDRAPARPLVVGTGVADFFALTGTFVVSSAGPESARVDIKKGNVEVVRVGTRASFPMSTGGAFFQAGLAKAVTESGLRVDRTPARTLSFPGPQDAVFTPDGRDVWVASGRQFTLWTRGGGTADKLFPPRRGFDRAAFTRDRNTLVSVNARDEKVLVRDLPDGEERAILDLKLPEARFWTVAPGAAWFAHVEPRPNHKRLRLVEGRTGAERYVREFEEAIGCLTATPDGKGIAVGLSDLGRGLNGKVLLLDAATGDRLAALPTQKKGQMSLAFSADGRHLAVGFNGLVQVWDVRSRELVKSITGFERVPTCLAFSTDGKTLAAGTQDGQVWVWSVASGKAVQLIELGTRGVRSVAFDKDGKRLLTVANNAPVALWDVAEADGMNDVQ